jgi:hypothetical protein
VKGDSGNQLSAFSLRGHDIGLWQNHFLKENPQLGRCYLKVLLCFALSILLI